LVVYLSGGGKGCNIHILTGAKSEIKCFNQKWLHHHQLESCSKDNNNNNNNNN
jgi:hypothetical protein